MADEGYRSVQVRVTNDTRGDLTVAAPQTGSGDEWLQGETPTHGAMLRQYSAVTWGVSTNDVNASTSAMVQLAGLGSWPVTIVFSNSANGVSACSVSPNDAIMGSVTAVDTGEANHSLYEVQLIPG